MPNIASGMKSKSVIKWHTANEIDNQQYNIETEKIASTVIIPTDALLCKNTNCTKHCDDIDTFYAAIISALKLSATVAYLPPLLVIKVILSPAGMSM